MTAIASTQRNGALASQIEGGNNLSQVSQVIESSGDEPWAEFCSGLKEPAFLLAVTGFGDLDYA